MLNIIRKRNPFAYKLPKTQTGERTYWRKFYGQAGRRWTLRFFMLFCFLALFSDFLANQKPIYCDLEELKTGQRYQFSPILYDYAVDLGLDNWEIKWKQLNWYAPKEDQWRYHQVLFPPITYSAKQVDLQNTLVGPKDKQAIVGYMRPHYLGTDPLGRDLAAGLLHGCRTALLVGLVAMSIAALIGILLGALAGYYGDERLYWKRAYFLAFFLGLFAFCFLAFVWGAYPLGELLRSGNFLKAGFYLSILGILIAACSSLLGWSLGLLPFLSTRIRLPLDLAIMRFIELINSIPVLLLILAILPLIKDSSIYTVMVLIGLLSWTGIAKFIRAEMLRIRTLPYVEAARALGYQELSIIWRQALPNALPPVLIALAFGMASAVLTESFLSFINVGLPPEQVSWGSLLRTARDAGISAWWLALFPGLAIFFTLSIFNLLGEGINKTLDPKEV